jgi:acyl-CoA synthetase (AMP-forming)/AMP-acid ligase II
MMLSPNRPDETILDRLRAHADSRPEQLAYRFLRDENGSDTLPSGQLERRVRGLTAHLREHAAPGDRGLLLYPPGLEFIEAFLARLAAGISAVPACPPRRNRNAERLRAIVKDAQPRLIRTTDKVLPTVETSELGNVEVDGRSGPARRRLVGIVARCRRSLLAPLVPRNTAGLKSSVQSYPDRSRWSDV